MTNVTMPRAVVYTDDRGRVNLHKFNRDRHASFSVDVRDDGTIVLTPAVTVTAAELAQLQAAAKAASDG